MEPPRARARLASFAMISLLALGAAACGTSESGAPALSGADSSTASELKTTTTDPGPATTATAAPTAASTSTSAVAPDVAKADFQLRPVLAVERCGAIAGGETDPGQDVLTEDDLGKDDDAICYLVGPAAADGNDIATAEAARYGAGQWLVSVTVAEPSRVRLNAVFNACYQGDLTCPGTTGPGAVAIVVDGTVSSAPAVQAEDLANDAFTISGDFTEAEAQRLASALNG